MRIVRLFWCVVLCCIVILHHPAEAQTESRPRGNVSFVSSEKMQAESGQAAQSEAAVSIGRLNEFVLDGTESCVEIKKGSSSIRPTLAAVTNAASYNNRIAPGGLAVLWGTRFSNPGEEYAATTTPLPRVLGRVQVLWRATDWDLMISGWRNDCGWRAAPLLYVGPNQINFQVPMFYYKPFDEEEGDGYARFSNFEGRDYEFIVLQVLPDGFTKVSSNTIRLKVNSHAPEFFSNAVFDYPAWQTPTNVFPGQVLVAYLTGLGKISDHEPEGSIPPNPPWTTRFPTFVEYRTPFGARLLRTNYLYAGRAPGFAGVDQFNFTVPFLPVNQGDAIRLHICTGADNGDRCSEQGMLFYYQTP